MIKILINFYRKQKKTTHNYRVNIVNQFRDVIDKTTGDVARKYSKVAGDKIAAPQRQKQILEEMQDLLVSGSGANGKMIPMFMK